MNHHLFIIAHRRESSILRKGEYEEGRMYLLQSNFGQWTHLLGHWDFFHSV